MRKLPTWYDRLDHSPKCWCLSCWRGKDAVIEWVREKKEENINPSNPTKEELDNGKN